MQCMQHAKACLFASAWVDSLSVSTLQDLSELCRLSDGMNECTRCSQRVSEGRLGPKRLLHWGFKTASRRAHRHSIYSCSSRVLSCHNLTVVPCQNVKYGMIDLLVCYLAQFHVRWKCQLQIHIPAARKSVKYLKHPQLGEPFLLRVFGLSRTIYVNYIHISCMISTITLIITAVMRATQMAMRGAEKTSICLRKMFSNRIPTLFYWNPRVSRSSWRRFATEKPKGFSWKRFALLSRLKVEHYTLLIHPLRSRSEYIPGRKTFLCRFSIQSFQSPIYCKWI